MLNEILMLFIGYFIGKILEKLTPIVLGKLIKRMKKAEDFKKLTMKIVERYSISDLVIFACDSKEYKIPILVDSKTEFLDIDLAAKGLLSEIKPARNFHSNWLYIFKQKIIGKRLFNGKICYLRHINCEGSINIRYSVCSYFEYISKYNKLSRSIKKNKRWKLIYTDFNDALCVNKHPIPLTCHVSIIMKLDNEYKVLLQRRSLETAVHPGMISTLPSYGVSPHTGVSSDELLYYNFIKEFAEELYNEDELIEENLNKDPKWFYDNPHVNKLLQLKTDNKLLCKLSGFGFDALDGTFTMSVFVLIQDSEVSDKLVKAINCNWEIEKADHNSSNFFYEDINSKKIDDYIISREMSPEAAFSIICARKHLSKLEERSESNRIFNEPSVCFREENNF